MLVAFTLALFIKKLFSFFNRFSKFLSFFKFLHEQAKFVKCCLRNIVLIYLKTDVVRLQQRILQL
jgi:hypothetical protein